MTAAEGATAGPWQRRDWLCVGLLMAAAVILYPALFAPLLARFGPRVNGPPDFLTYYLPIAENILSGQGIRMEPGGPLNTYRPPGFPIYYAAVLWVSRGTGLSDWRVYTIFSGWSAAAVAAGIYVLTRFAAGRRPALVAGLAAILLPQYAWSSAVRLSEGPFMPLWVWTMVASVWAASRSGFTRSMLAGALLAAATHVRPATVFFPVCFLLAVTVRKGWTWPRKLSLATGYVLGFALASAPWMWFACRQEGRIIPYASRPVSHSVKTMFKTMSEVGLKTPIVQEAIALADAGRLQTTGDVLAFYLRELRAEPAETFPVLVRVMIWPWYMTESGRTVWINVLTSAVLAPLALYGCWRWRGHPTGALVVYLAAWSLLYFWAVASATSLIFRYLLPGLYALLPAVGVALAGQATLPHRQNGTWGADYAGTRA